MKKITKKKIKTWFVTGASSGVGHELCKQLLDRGYNVIAVSRRVPDFNNENALCLSCDVTKIENVKNVVKKGIEKFGKIDVLVNNAGKLTSVTIEDETIEHLKEIFEVNYFGTFNTMKVLIPYFREWGYGTIINNTSKSGITPRCFGAAYCSSKYAVEGLTGVCYRECARFIRVMAFELGWYPSSGIKPDGKISMKNIHPIYHDLRNIDIKSKYKFNNDLENTIKLIINEVEKEKMPRHLILGYDGLLYAKSELNLFLANYKYSKKVGKCSYKIIHSQNKIFSISFDNSSNNHHIIFTILGIKVKFKIKK